MNEIVVKGLKKSFGLRNVFQNLSFTLKPGQITAVTGPSGCGKSTLLNILGTLETADEGQILLDGQRHLKSTKGISSKMRREFVSFIFQNFALIEDWTVGQNLMLGLKYQKITKTEKQKRIDEVLKQFGLLNWKNEKVFTLSGGQQQRIAIARAVLQDHPLILCDEPTASLDQENSKLIMKALQTMADSGKIVVVATHDMDLVKQCHSVIRLKGNAGRRVDATNFIYSN